MRLAAPMLLIACLVLTGCQRSTPPPASPAPTNTEPAPAPAPAAD